MIFMTGSPALETALEAIEYGAFRYLLKPVPPEALLEVVERAVAVHKLARVRREASQVQEPQAASKPIGDRAGLEARFASRRWSKLWVAAQPIVSWSGQQHRSRTRRCCGPTSRRCAARSISSTRPSGWARPPSWGGIIRGHVARDHAGHAAGGAHVRQPASRGSRGRRAVRGRRRADAVRESGGPGDHGARGAGSDSRAAARA